MRRAIQRCGTRPRAARGDGFTMLELLLALGLFLLLAAGATALQLTALRASEDAGRRSRATLLARDYLDRVAMTPRSATAPAVKIPAEGSPRAHCRSGQACAPAQLARAVLGDWVVALRGGVIDGAQLRTLLPGARACPIAQPAGFSLALAWPELSKRGPGPGGVSCDVPHAHAASALLLWRYAGPSS